MKPAAVVLRSLTEVLLFALSGCTAPEKPAGLASLDHPPLIYITNDVHLLADALHDDGPRYQRIIGEGDGKNTEMIPSLLRTLLRTAQEERPDMILFNGDLTFNGEKESHQALAQEMAAIEALGVKVFVIPGNHDINNPWARTYFNERASYAPAVGPREFETIYADFGYREAVSRDRETLSYTVRPMPGLRLLMLDSAKYKNNRELGSPETAGAIPESTRKWICAEAEAAKKDGDRIVAAMHHSLMDHHPMVNRGFTIENAASLRELFAELGINFILTGHIHAQDISQRQTSSGSIVYDIATSALAVYPHQIGVLRFNSEQAGWNYSVKALDVEAWARAGGLQDQRLLQFNAWSEEFFRRVSEDMVRRRLSATALRLSAEELESLSILVGTLNARYFAGSEYLNAQDIYDSQGYQLLETYKFDFLYEYAKTIMEDAPPPNRELFIPVSPF
ncbi:metallophosphoesterase [Leadbettera azotonutricia]|uniref:5'-Nucleotidase domain protein n=1 Tax=Leadbettera azotonutricia (strain ATCC BAA-888 / DSM 13862 / ZAS-9) TaxID=545695 RepID=F5Y6M3_LEAAZ|nr:metallophosphoesterase [Leadbettera azotonutricia]AEF82582.1 5'-Nucleotidase domain protein [Leadbettera azotonutricia ZAS-9]